MQGAAGATTGATGAGWVPPCTRYVFCGATLDPALGTVGVVAQPAIIAPAIVVLATVGYAGATLHAGAIALETGAAAAARWAILGETPAGSTRPAENELPTLVAVDGPQHDISRNHVEIRAEGEHVLAVDLASTNGTVLLRGGHDPVRLHPNEPTMVIDADVLDLGDGVTLTFEDLP
jgi:hypothetical protein